MKSIVEKNATNSFLVENASRTPQIVLIFPITRNEDGSQGRWRSVVDLVESSKINSLIVVDKTNGNTATRYFIENFDSVAKNLYVLPRSISESHYETLGEIKLGDNLWVMQLHDDDEWSGYLALPDEVQPSSAYYSNFFMQNGSGKLSEVLDFSIPARINFTLLPSYIWNQFTLMIKDQGFQVAASLDGTLNQMAGLTCRFIPIQNFSYFYDNHNWEGRKSSKQSLEKLTKNAGWGKWASIDIALFNRQLDNLCSLYYVQGIAEREDLKLVYSSLMNEFKLSLKRRMYGKLAAVILRVLKILIKLMPVCTQQRRAMEKIDSRLTREIFISQASHVKDLRDVIDLIRKLREGKRFQNLDSRFIFWNGILTRLNIGRNR